MFIFKYLNIKFYFDTLIRLKYAVMIFLIFYMHIIRIVFLQILTYYKYKVKLIKVLIFL